MNIAVIIAVAILIEGLVEYGKNITDMFYGGEKKTAITQLLLVSHLHLLLVLICLYHLD